MLNGFSFALLLLSAPQVLLGAIYHDIDTTTPLKCTLSSQHQNRIVVSEGRVGKVIFPDARISVQMEEDSGQIFVYALEDIVNETTISVITDTGLVQDLEVSFAEKSSEVVILREVLLSDCCAEESTRRLFSISCQVRDILNGVTPKGYVCFEGGRDVREICSGVFTEKLAIFEGQLETLYLYRVINYSGSCVCLHETQLDPNGASAWIFLENNSLNPKGDTLAIVASKRGCEY